MRIFSVNFERGEKSFKTCFKVLSDFSSSFFCHVLKTQIFWEREAGVVFYSYLLINATTVILVLVHRPNYVYIRCEKYTYIYVCTQRQYELNS